MTPAMQKYLDALDSYVDARIALHEASQEKAASEKRQPGVMIVDREEWQERAAREYEDAAKLARQRKFELRQIFEKLVGKG